MAVIAQAQVLVVGTGFAGLSAALAASEVGAEVLVVGDRAVGRSNSVMAQGGIQVPADNSTDSALMVSDMAAVGGELTDPGRVTRFVSELPQLTERLARWGLEFDIGDDGEPLRRTAGGLSSPRILTVGDGIGRPLMQVLRDRVASSCVVLPQTPVKEVRRHGASFEASTGSGDIVASSLVIATGGTAYEKARSENELTSNPPNENRRLRASLKALGMRETEPGRFQWHPFGLVDSRRGVTVSCVPESLAALGLRLVDAGGIDVCELPAPRGVVVSTMRDHGVDLRLDLSKVDPVELRHFPKVRGQWASYGPEPLVTPVLHYELSGFPVDLDQGAGVPGLFLAGEMIDGVHGRERLMGNGVTDSLVHGHRAGLSAARYVRAS